MRTVATPMPPGALGGQPDAVCVTPVNTAWTVSLLDPVSGEPVELGAEVRDELIAVEHAARSFN